MLSHQVTKIDIPNINTERLSLVPPSQECFSSYKQFYTDPVASQLYGGPLSEEAAWTRLKSDLGSWYLLGFGVWAIKYNGRYVGTCGFWQGKDWPRELTWWLLPAVRRKGLALESSLAVIVHAYDVWTWEKVETYMDDKNSPARKLVEKLGGIKNRREQFPDGLFRDIYSLPKPTT